MPKYIVSACLAGKQCRYNGTDALCPAVASLVQRGDAVAVCPEELGGFGTPREPAEQRGEQIVTKSDKDVTSMFTAGAQAGVAIARTQKCTHAILKSKSPSCGVGQVYDGTFTGKLVHGDGVFAKELRQAGLAVMTTEEFLRQPAS